MKVLHEFIDGPRQCPYLTDRQSSLEYQVVVNLHPRSYEELMNQGFRKFSYMLFRPVCESCKACQPLRVLVADFSPSRSMKRCIRRNAKLEVTVQRAKADAERIALYNRYHLERAIHKGWIPNEISVEQYRENFLQSEILVEELALYENGTLSGLLLFEELEQGLSLIYHFYSGSDERSSLGLRLIIKAIELAKARGKSYAYLGYYIEACESMNYKARFRPCEILSDGTWRDAGSASEKR